MGRLHRMVAVAAMTCLVWQGACAQTQIRPSDATQGEMVSPPSEFPGLPLRRDSDLHAERGVPLLLMGIIGLGAVGGAVLWRTRMNRTGGSQAKSRLKAVDVLRLTPQTTLHVVHWQGDELLIASTAQCATLLARKPLVESEGVLPP